MNALPERWWVLTPVRPGITGVDTGLIPDPLTSLEAWARFYHRDLEELDDKAIWAEIRRIENAVASGERRGRAWLFDRLKRLEAEARRRRQAK